MPEDAYAAAGVSIATSDAGVRALVDVLRTIDPGRPSRSLLGSGHYASVLRVSDDLAIALCTDGVGSKLVVAEQTGRLDTVGIDCIAMNVNDLICVGAEPIAMLDYLAVEQPDPAALAQIAQGLKAGAEERRHRDPRRRARGAARAHPRPPEPARLRPLRRRVRHGRARRARHRRRGRARATRSSACPPAACTPTATRSRATPCSSRAASRSTTRRPSSAAPRSPTRCSSRPSSTCARSSSCWPPAPRPRPRPGAHHRRRPGQPPAPQRRTSASAIDAPLPVPPIFGLIARCGAVAEAEMWEVFNMGCGFVAVVAEADADDGRRGCSRRIIRAARGSARSPIVPGRSSVLTPPRRGIALARNIPCGSPIG